MNKKFVKARNEYCTFEKYISAPYMRKSFWISGKLKTAEIEISAFGFYHLFINGKKITKGELAPYISNADHLCYYDKYDILPLLSEGENVVGILLGNGFYNNPGGTIWDFHTAECRNAPCVALECRMSYEDREEIFTAEDGFVWTESPIYFDDYRMGVYYDARKETEGWALPKTDVSSWKPVIKSDIPRGELKECNVEPIRVTKRIHPIKITKKENGWLYDFGENNAGVCELKISGKAGQKVTFWHGEILNDGEFYFKNIIFEREGFEFYKEYNQKDIYILKGDGEEIYSPSFVYHGFRYVFVEGITDEQATKDLLTYLVMSSDIKVSGGFECSDDVANTICEMTKRSDISNFYYFPTDCPHREKNGWTGDAALSAEQLLLNYHCETSLEEWLCNIRKAQTEEGMLPGIIPTYTWGYSWGNGPAYDKVLFELTYQIFRYRGNTKIVEDNAHAMMAYLEYVMRRRNKDGTISIGLGDWVPVNKYCEDYDSPLALTDSIMVLDIAKKSEIMFNAVGLTNNVVYAKNVYDIMRKTIRENLLDGMIAKGNCQTSQAMCLHYGVFNKDEEQEAFGKLLEILKKNDNKFNCGMLGVRVLFHVLSDFGYGELAYDMIKGPEFPSYGYWIKRGETTLCEQFINIELRTDQPASSHNHHFLGDVSHWYTEKVAGLNVISHNKLVIKPDFLKQLDFASAWYELPTGKASVYWKKTDKGIKLDIQSPVEYDIVIPKGYKEKDGYYYKEI